MQYKRFLILSAFALVITGLHAQSHMRIHHKGGGHSDARIDSAESRQNSTEGQIYSKIEDLYAYMRDKRGYDQMDEYIREEVLLLQGVEYTILEKVTGECASRVYNALMHQPHCQDQRRFILFRCLNALKPLISRRSRLVQTICKPISGRHRIAWT